MNGKILAKNKGIISIYSNRVCYSVFLKGFSRFKDKNLFIGDDVLLTENIVNIKDLISPKNKLDKLAIHNVNECYLLIDEEKDTSLEFDSLLNYLKENSVKVNFVYKNENLNEIYKNYPTIKKIKFSELSDELRLKLEKKITLLMIGRGFKELIKETIEDAKNNISNLCLSLDIDETKNESVLFPILKGYIAFIEEFDKIKLES